jgi:hypothetical protein
VDEDLMIDWDAELKSENPNGDMIPIAAGSWETWSDPGQRCT